MDPALLRNISLQTNDNGEADAQIALVARRLIDKDGGVKFNPDDVPATLLAMVAALSAAQKTALGASLGVAYKVWVGVMSQSGTAAPTATVYGNTLGGNIVWTRTSAGVYAGTLAGAFPAGKIFPVSGFADPLASLFYTVARASNDVVSLTTTDGDGVLNNTPVEIRVYN